MSVKPLRADQTASVVTLAAVSLLGFGVGWWCRASSINPRASILSFRHPSPAAAAPGQSPEQVPSFVSAVAAADTGSERMLHLAQAAAPLDQSQLAAELETERVRLLRTHSPDALPAETLLARYAAMDPAAAAAWVMQMNAALWIQPQWLAVTLGAWMAQDPDAAWAWSQGQRQSDVYKYIQYDLFDALAAVNPRLALQRLTPEAVKDESLVENVFAKAAMQDLPSARARAMQLPAAAAKPALCKVVEVAVRRGEPAEAYTCATQLPVGGLRMNATSTFYGTWGQTDPAAAAAWMAGRGTADLPAYGENMAGVWAAVDPAAAVAWCQHFPPALRANILRSAISSWSESDPRAASTYAAALPQPIQDDVLSSAVSTWAESDRAAALAWAEGLPIGEARLRAREVVYADWAEQDPRACLEYLSRQPDLTALGDAVGAAVTYWSTANPMELWKWSQSTAAWAGSDQRAAAASSALGAIASADPVQASSLFGQLPAKAQPDAASLVVQAWVKLDPAAAAQWTAALPKGKTRAAACESLMQAWADRDVPAAAAWIGAQPAGDATDAGIASLINTSADQLQPADAIQLAQRLQKTDLRGEAMGSIATNWIKQDRTAASAWINSSDDFSAEVRDELLKPDDDTASNQ